MNPYIVFAGMAKNVDRYIGRVLNHVDFHESIRKKGGKLFINTAFLTDGPGKSTQPMQPKMPYTYLFNFINPAS